MIDYHYNQGLNILEAKISGILTITDIVNHFDLLTKNDSLKDSLKVLIDCRSAVFDIKIKKDEFDPVYNAIKNALYKFKNIYEALIIEQPNQTVVATLFEIYNTDILNYHVTIFYTEDAAKRWLLNYK